jgi:hypothetical protein
MAEPAGFSLALFALILICKSLKLFTAGALESPLLVSRNSPIYDLTPRMSGNPVKLRSDRARRIPLRLELLWGREGNAKNVTEPCSCGMFSASSPEYTHSLSLPNLSEARRN